MTAHPPVILNTFIPVSPARAVPSLAPGGSREGESAFNARLQDAHRQHAPAAHDSADQASRRAGASRTASSNTTSATAASAGAGDTKSGAVSDADTANTDPTTSLASSVLGLIDQSSGDTGGGVDRTLDPTSAKAAANKLPTVSGTPAAAPTSISTALMLAVAVPLANAPAVSTADNATPSSGATAGGAATTDLTTALAGGAGALQAGGGGAGDDSGSTADGGTAAASFAAVGGSLLGLGSASLGQAAIGTLFGTAHVAGPAASSATDAAAIPTTGDLATLHGALGAGAVGPSFISIPATSHSLTVNAPVNSPAFSQELVQQVAWLGGQDIKQAQIRLHPQDLGQLNVNVSIAHGKVDVAFLAQHPNAVAAVQQSLDQLSQMLNSQGLSLGQATVGQQNAQQQSGGSSPGASVLAGNGGDDGADVSLAPLTRTTALGLVDTFA